MTILRFSPEHILPWTLLLCLLLSCHSLTAQADMTQPSDTAGSPVAQIIDKPFYEAVDNSHQLADRFRLQLSGFKLLPGAMLETWQKIATKHSTGYPFVLIAQICFVLVAGVLLELFLRRRLRNPYAAISDPSSSKGFLFKAIRIGLGIAMEGLFMFSFVLITFSLYIMIFPEKGIAAAIASN